MELKLTDGRYVPGRAGGIDTVTGDEELAQRIAMKLGARRGGFAAMPDYGSRMYALLRGVKPSERADAARACAAEALSDEPDLTVESAELTPDGDGGARVALTLSRGGISLSAEVSI